MEAASLRAREGSVKLLLLPGMDGTGLLFEPFLEALPVWLKPQVVASPAHEPLGYAELLSVVRSACPLLEEFVVLAESFSGPLAILLAASQPPGLRGAILCASFIRCPLRTPFRWLAAAALPIMFRLAPLWPARWALLGRHETVRLRQSFATALASVSSEALAARARAVASVDVTVELRMCQVPLLYLAGRQDRVVPVRCLRAIQQERPDTQVVELPGPHLLLPTLPAQAAHEVGQFIERIQPNL